MIAVLKDRKGFTKSEYINSPIPMIHIPVLASPSLGLQPSPDMIVKPEIFTFYRDEELEDQVWLYLER